MKNTQQIDTIKTPEQLVQLKSEILHGLANIQKQYQDLKDKMQEIDHHLDYHLIKLEINGYSVYSRINQDKIEEEARKSDKTISQACWSYYAKKSGILELMTDKSRKEYEKSLKETNGFDIQSAKLWLEQMNDKYLNTIETLFQETWEDLTRAKYGNWNNRKQRNNTKVESFFIIEYGCYSDYFTSFKIHENSILNRLERCFLLLEGNKPNQYPNRLSDKVNEAKTKLYKDKYFQLKLHKNGNIHVRIQNAKLLEKFNQICGMADRSKLGNDVKIQKF